MRFFSRVFFIAVVALPLPAALITYTDSAAFSSSLAITPALLTFENVAVGSATTITPAAGVSITWVNQESNTVRNVQDPARGFNTTPGGSHYIAVDSADLSQPASATFSFTNGIYAFGANFTGIGNSSGGVSILFNDGAVQTFQIAAPSSKPVGAQLFFGFTDPGTSISAVTIQVGTLGGSSDDIFGIDDVRYAPVLTPEPATWLTGSFALAAILLSWRRRRSLL